MTLLIEVMNSEYADEREVDDLLRKHGVSLSERAKRQPNGNVGIFLGWYDLPGVKRLGPKIPEEVEDQLEIMYTYRYVVPDGHSLTEGIYEHDDIEEMSVLHGLFDGERVSRVTIVSESLPLIIDLYEDLRDGKLKPARDWSAKPRSPVEPKGEKEASGQHALPQKAATAPQAA